MSGRIDSVYPIIKGAELTPLAAHFGRDSPRQKKEERKMGGEEEWTPPKEREKEKGGDLSVGKLMTEMLPYEKSSLRLPPRIKLTACSTVER